MTRTQPTAHGKTVLLPTGAVDNHCHVLVAGDPSVPGAKYAPFDAPLSMYEENLRALGASRGVLVTASTYGTNNEPLLNALRGSTIPLRGIAVVDRDISDADLSAMHEEGVRGLRLQDRFAGGAPLDALAQLGDRISSMGWHLEIWTDFTEHLDWLPDAIRQCRVPVVLDHLGYFPMESPQQDAATSLMTDLASDGHIWITLSGSHRLAPALPPSAGGKHVAPRVHQLLDRVPSRLLWGSDWPHVAPPNGAPTIDNLLTEIDTWFSRDQALVRQVTIANNAACYGF